MGTGRRGLTPVSKEGKGQNIYPLKNRR